MLLIHNMNQFQMHCAKCKKLASMIHDTIYVSEKLVRKAQSTDQGSGSLGRERCAYGGMCAW
jgi:hypothetical protein